jgi:2-oxoglutarate dehydrogenase E2 component (dihydrolipoamide succinyltransferase)
MATGTVLEVVMPQMGVSVSEGTVTRWLRNVGDAVAADESLLEVSTDKVDTEVPSPGGGVLQEILVAEGETVAVGTVLARIGSGPAHEEAPPDEVAPAAPEAEAAPTTVPARPAPAEEEPVPEPPADERVTAGPPPAPEPRREGDADGEPAHTFVSPVVARIAAAHGIDPATIEGTGKGGRVTKKDVLAFVEGTEARPPSEAPAPAAEALPSPAAAPAPPQPPVTPPPPPSPAAPSARADLPPTTAAAVAPAPTPEPEEERPLEPGEQLAPMSLMRRGIAEHMRRSLDTAAHVTSVIEVDVSKMVAIRERIKSEFASSHGVNATYLAFIARATVETLQDWPWVNAELRGESILTRSHVNLGIAVALEEGKGLIVPVVRHSEDLNLLGMARAIADLAERARTRKLLPDDVQGGTFTITNPGGYGTLLGTPIINQPQSAILGTYAIVKRPWVIADDEGQDAIAIRSIMNLTLTYDHRLVDGAYGAQFLRDLARRLETWGEADY